MSPSSSPPSTPPRDRSENTVQIHDAIREQRRRNSRHINFENTLSSLVGRFAISTHSTLANPSFVERLNECETDNQS